MQALMLAAGMGKRLGRFTQNGTKCMVQVNGISLIERTAKALAKSGIRKFIIVTGYKSHILKDFISANFSVPELRGMEISYIENPDYGTTNNIYSLYLARAELEKDDTILLESDLIFDSEIIHDIVCSPFKSCAVVSPFQSWMDGTCALVGKDGGIAAILDKDAFSWNDTGSYYKTVNIYKFSKEFSSRYYIPFLEAYQKACGKNEYYEQVLKVLALIGTSGLKAFPVSGDRWHEIDDPEDLETASHKFSPAEQKLAYMEKRYGGYWRFPELKDFCYLVNPHFPPQKMADEMKSNFTVLTSSYPSGAKEQSLLAAKIFGILPEHICVGNGAAELIKSLSECLTGKVAVPFPTFNEYPERFGALQTVEIKTDATDFSCSAEEILKTVDKEQCSAVLLINPDNPTGRFMKKDEVLFLAGELQKRNMQLIFDESFIDFADSECRYTLIDEKIIHTFQNIIIIKSISKSYGIPGLRLGVLVHANEQLISKISKENAIWNINSFAEHFLQIFDKHHSSYKNACDKIAEERRRFMAKLRKIRQLEVFESQSNYVLCRLNGTISSHQLAVKLLARYNILIKDLSSKKGFDGKNFMRIAVKSQADDDFLTEKLSEELQ